MIGLNFTQASPADTWVITHNFGFKPVCDVWLDDVGLIQKVLPASIIHVSDDELQVIFTTPHSGGARLLGDEAYHFPTVSSIDPGSP